MSKKYAVLVAVVVAIVYAIFSYAYTKSQSILVTMPLEAPKAGQTLQWKDGPDFPRWTSGYEEPGVFKILSDDEYRQLTIHLSRPFEASLREDLLAVPGVDIVRTTRTGQGHYSQYEITAEVGEMFDLQKVIEDLIAPLRKFHGVPEDDPPPVKQEPEGVAL